MRCSTGAWFEDDVETFIHARLVDYHDWRQPHTDHTIVGLELADHGLIAVGSHEEEFVRESGELVTSNYLECAAVSTNLQGALLPVAAVAGERPTGLRRVPIAPLRRPAPVIGPTPRMP